MTTDLLSPEMQNAIASSITHWAEMSKEAIASAAIEYERPSAVFKPRIFMDGDQWCALYGDNLQDGVAGFGKSPADAMWNFDAAWRKPLDGARSPA